MTLHRYNSNLCGVDSHRAVIGTWLPSTHVGKDFEIQNKMTPRGAVEVVSNDRRGVVSFVRGEEHASRTRGFPAERLTKNHDFIPNEGESICTGEYTDAGR